MYKFNDVIEQALSNTSVTTADEFINEYCKIEISNLNNKYNALQRFVHEDADTTSEYISWFDEYKYNEWKNEAQNKLDKLNGILDSLKGLSHDSTSEEILAESNAIFDTLTTKLNYGTINERQFNKMLNDQRNAVHTNKYFDSDMINLKVFIDTLSDYYDDDTISDIVSKYSTYRNESDDNLSHLYMYLYNTLVQLYSSKKRVCTDIIEACDSDISSMRMYNNECTSIKNKATSLAVKYFITSDDELYDRAIDNINEQFMKVHNLVHEYTIDYIKEAVCKELAKINVEAFDYTKTLESIVDQHRYSNIGKIVDASCKYLTNNLIKIVITRTINTTNNSNKILNYYRAIRYVSSVAYTVCNSLINMFHKHIESLCNAGIDTQCYVIKENVLPYVLMHGSLSISYNDYIKRYAVPERSQVMKCIHELVTRIQNDLVYDYKQTQEYTNTLNKMLLRSIRCIDNVLVMKNNEDNSVTLFVRSFNASTMYTSKEIINVYNNVFNKHARTMRSIMLDNNVSKYIHATKERKQVNKKRLLLYYIAM